MAAYSNVWDKQVHHTSLCYKGMDKDSILDSIRF